MIFSEIFLLIPIALYPIVAGRYVPFFHPGVNVFSGRGGKHSPKPTGNVVVPVLL
jgi:hypothetical protein